MVLDSGTYTFANVSAINIDPPSVSSGTSGTTMTGLYIWNQGRAGITNVYGIYIVNPSVARGINIGLVHRGHLALNGSVGIGDRQRQRYRRPQCQPAT